MSNKVLTKKYGLTLLLVLYFINWGGLYPLCTLFTGEGLVSDLLVLLIFFICAAIKHDKIKIYRKWLFFLLGTLILNYVSTYYFEDRDLLTAFKSTIFIYYLFLYFPLVLISPSIKDLENVIITIGIYLLVLYFFQQVMLPTPIVISLINGWRVNSVEFDLMRYTLGGELFMYLFQLLCLNRFLVQKKKIYLFAVILVAVMSLLHGYRSGMFAMVSGLVYVYVCVNGIKINSKTISIMLLICLFFLFIDQIPIISDVLNQISEKQERQFSGGNNWYDLDRIIELEFFYNEQIKNIFEWIFGCGLLSKNEYVFVPQSFYWINWVDLGFIGLSFMGGILMTICWIRLLVLNMGKKPIGYQYLPAFSILVIMGTLTLNMAFADNAPAVQAFALYLGSRIYKQ